MTGPGERRALRMGSAMSLAAICLLCACSDDTSSAAAAGGSASNQGLPLTDCALPPQAGDVVSCQVLASPVCTAEWDRSSFTCQGGNQRPEPCKDEGTLAICLLVADKTVRVYGPGGESALVEAEQQCAAASGKWCAAAKK